MNKFIGTGTALITPFNKDLTIDFISLEKLINFQIKNGIDYLVVLGTTGENVVLSTSEKQNVLNFCKKINNNRLPIVVGIGGNNTLSVVNEIKSMDLSGVSAILSVSPSYNKPSQEGIYKHYKIIAQSTEIPIILYNVPSRTSSNISSDTTLRLSCDYKNIIGIKEASGNFDQVMKIIKKKTSDFLLISGDDALTIPMIHMGAEGVISVLAQSIPNKFSKMVSLALTKNIYESNKLHYRIYDCYDPIYSEGNPVGIKAYLEVLGICKSFVRPPLVKASNNTIKKLRNLNI